MMRVLFISEAPERRRELIGFLCEYLASRRFTDVRVENARLGLVRLDQNTNLFSVVLLDLHPEHSAKSTLAALRRPNGDPPVVLCTYPAYAPLIAECAVDHGGAKACLHVPAEKLKDRETVLPFFREHLAELPDPEPADEATEIIGIS